MYSKTISIFSKKTFSLVLIFSLIYSLTPLENFIPTVYAAAPTGVGSITGSYKHSSGDTAASFASGDSASTSGTDGSLILTLNPTSGGTIACTGSDSLTYSWTVDLNANGSFSPIQSTATIYDGEDENALTINISGFNSLNNITHLYKATVTCGSDNVEKTFSVSFDSTAPTFSTQPTATVSSTTATVTFGINEASSIAFKSGISTCDITHSEDVASGNSLTITPTVTANTVYSACVLIATDAAGNARGSNAFTIGAPPKPVITLHDGSNTGSTDDTITNDNDPILLISNVAEGDSIEVFQDGVSLGPVNVASASQIPRQFSLDSDSLTNDKDYIFTAVTTRGGVVSPTSDPFTITLDTRAPIFSTQPTSSVTGTTATISFNIDESSSVTFKSVPTCGITHTKEDITLAGGTTSYSITAPVTTGTVYTGCILTATDVAENVRESNAFGTGKPSAPTLALTTASNSGSTSDNITRDDTPTIKVSGVAADDVVTLYIGNTQIGTGTVQSGDTTVDITTSQLSEGSNAITGKTTRSSVDSGLSSALTLTIDTSAPSAPTGLDLIAGDDTGSSDSDDITKDTTISITVAGDENGASIQLKNGGTDIGSPAEVVSGAASISITLTEGAHTITAVQTDVAGNPSVESAGLLITVDTTAPTVSSANVYQGSSTTDKYLKAGDTATVAVVFNEDVTLSGTHTIQGQTTSTPVGSGTTYTLTATLPSSADAGKIGYDLGTVTDVAGNAATPASTVPTITQNATTSVWSGDGAIFDKVAPTASSLKLFNRDSTPVELSIKDADGNTYTNLNAFNIKAAWTALSGSIAPLKEIKFYKGSGSTPTWNVTPISGSTGISIANNSILDRTYEYTSGLPSEGILEHYSVTIEDEAGNVSSNIPTPFPSIIIDSTAPVVDEITITSNNAKNGAYAKEGDVITVSFKVKEDVSGVNPTLSITLGGKSIDATTSSGSNAASVSSTTYKKSDVTDATDKLTYQATYTVPASGDGFQTDGTLTLSIPTFNDAVGNPSSASGSVTTGITIDRVAPLAPNQADLESEDDTEGTNTANTDTDDYTQDLSDGYKISSCAEADSDIRVFVAGTETDLPTGTLPNLVFETSADGSTCTNGLNTAAKEFIYNVDGAASGAGALVGTDIGAEFAITFKAEDAAGNLSTDSTALTVSVDSEASKPTIQIDANSNSGISADTRTNDTTPTFNLGVLEDGSKSVVYILTDTDNDGVIDTGETTEEILSKEIANVANASTTKTQTTTLTVGDATNSGATGTGASALSDGVYKLFVTHTDKAGNSTNSDILTVYIDTEAPDKPAKPDLNSQDDSYGINANTQRTGDWKDDITNIQENLSFATQSSPFDGTTTSAETDATEQHILKFYKIPESFINVDANTGEITTVANVNKTELKPTTTSQLTGAGNLATVSAGASTDRYDYQYETTSTGSVGRVSDLYTTGVGNILEEGIHYFISTQVDDAGNESEFSDILKVKVDITAPIPVTEDLELHPYSDTGESSTDKQTSNVTPIFRTVGESSSADVDYYEIRRIRLNDAFETADANEGWIYPSDAGTKDNSTAQQSLYKYNSENGFAADGTTREVPTLVAATSSESDPYADGLTVEVQSMNVSHFNTWYYFSVYAVDIAGNARRGVDANNVRILVPPPTPATPDLNVNDDSTNGLSGANADNVTNATEWVFDGSYENVTQPEIDNDAAVGVREVIVSLIPSATSSLETKTVTLVRNTEDASKNDISVTTRSGQEDLYGFSATFDLATLYGNDLIDGEYTITAVAVNGAGEQGKVSASLTVTLDRVSPDLSTSDYDVTVIRNETSEVKHTIAGDKEAGSSIDIIEVDEDGVKVGASVGTVSADALATFSTTVTAKDYPYRYAVIETDKANNTSTQKTIEDFQKVSVIELGDATNNFAAVDDKSTSTFKVSQLTSSQTCDTSSLTFTTYTEAGTASVSTGNAELCFESTYDSDTTSSRGERVVRYQTSNDTPNLASISVNQDDDTGRSQSDGITSVTSPNFDVTTLPNTPIKVFSRPTPSAAKAWLTDSGDGYDKIVLNYVDSAFTNGIGLNSEGTPMGVFKVKDAGKYKFTTIITESSATRYKVYAYNNTLNDDFNFGGSAGLNAATYGFCVDPDSPTTNLEPRITATAGVTDTQERIIDVAANSDVCFQIASDWGVAEIVDSLSVILEKVDESENPLSSPKTLTFENIRDVSLNTSAGAGFVTSEDAYTFNFANAVDNLLNDTTSDESGVVSGTSISNLEDANYQIGVQISLSQDANGDPVFTDAATVLDYVIDTSAPSAPTTPDLKDASDSNVNSDNITSDTTPTITVGGALATENITLSIGSETPKVAEVQTSQTSVDITADTLSDGTYSLSATSTDLAGNTSPTSASLSITVDTVVPVVTVVRTVGANNNADNSAKFIAVSNEIATITSEVLASGSCTTSATVDDTYSGAEITRATEDICFKAVDTAGNVGVASSEDAIQGIGGAGFTTGTLDSGTYYIQSGTRTFTGTTASGATVHLYSWKDTGTASDSEAGADSVIDASELTSLYSAVTSTSAISAELNIASDLVAIVGSITPSGQNTETPKIKLFDVIVDDVPLVIGNPGSGDYYKGAFIGSPQTNDTGISNYDLISKSDLSSAGIVFIGGSVDGDDTDTDNISCSVNGGTPVVGGAVNTADGTSSIYLSFDRHNS